MIIFIRQKSKKIIRKAGLIILLIMVCGLLGVSFSYAFNVKTEVLQEDPCNNNGVCEPARGENTSNCPGDCFLPQYFSQQKIIIRDLEIKDITSSSAVVLWQTNINVLCHLYLGKTLEYKEKIFSEGDYREKHFFFLNNLLSDQEYHFKIICQDTQRRKKESRDYKFKTLALPDVAPPANVSNFRAFPEDKKIILKWENPDDKDFKGVRIVRNDKFYPLDPENGIIIYEGKGNSFVDENLENGKRYFYGAFAYDKSGNFSSGAVVSAVPQGKIPVSPLPVPEEIFPSVSPLPEIEKIGIEDFIFIQNNKTIKPKKGKLLEVKAGLPLDIFLDYEKTPEVLKTIMITIEKENKFFSFLLRINKTKTFYTASLLAPEESGIYPFTIIILDYKNQALKKIKGILKIEKPKQLIGISQKNFFRRLWVYLAIIIIFSAIIIYINKKNKKLKQRSKKFY